MLQNTLPPPVQYTLQCVLHVEEAALQKQNIFPNLKMFAQENMNGYNLIISKNVINQNYTFVFITIFLPWKCTPYVDFIQRHHLFSLIAPLMSIKPDKYTNQIGF